MPMPTLRPYQTEPLRHIVESVSERRGLTFTVEMSRQAGKNELSAQAELLLLTLHWATGGNLVKASPTFKPQTINSIQRLRERLTQAGYRDHYRMEFGYQLVFGQARALFYSADRAANVVGATAHILLEMDEAQDVDRDKYDKEFRPMGATTNVTTVMYGTAWSDDTLLQRQIDTNLELEAHDGQRRHFAYDWQEVAKYNPDYARYVEAERARLGPEHPLFTTQYELKTLAGGGRFFSAQQRAQLAGEHAREYRPLHGRVYVAGLDLAGESEEAEDATLRSLKPMRDSTVLTIGEVTLGEEKTPAAQEPKPNPQDTDSPHWAPETPRLAPLQLYPSLPKVRIVEHYYRTGINHPALYAQVLDLLRNVWKVKRLAVDATGAGADFAAYLARALGESIVEKYVFTAQSKSHLAFQLLASVNAGGLKMYTQDGSPEHAQFWFQAERAKSALRANQTMTFYVDPTEGHDDFLMSTALLTQAATQYRPRSARGR